MNIIYERLQYFWKISIDRHYKTRLNIHQTRILFFVYPMYFLSVQLLPPTLQTIEFLFLSWFIYLCIDVDMLRYYSINTKKEKKMKKGTNSNISSLLWEWNFKFLKAHTWYWVLETPTRLTIFEIYWSGSQLRAQGPGFICF